MLSLDVWSKRTQSEAVGAYNHSKRNIMQQMISGADIQDISLVPISLDYGRSISSTGALWLREDGKELASSLAALEMLSISGPLGYRFNFNKVKQGRKEYPYCLK
ncbi:hypothetical protein ACU5EH_24010 [Aliivibrio salmonicida]|uniref:hypothetical protein n=1 Tax=Aliivibrio salmonicida TaxID=40269 RepID=UPI00406D4399